MKKSIMVLFIGLSLSWLIVVLAADQNTQSGSAGTPHAADKQGTRVTGQLTHIEGWHYTIKDSGGQEISFGVTSDTNDPDKVKEGDHIVAFIGEDRIAIRINNMKKKS